jgi:hypothetical protein
MLSLAQLANLETYRDIQANLFDPKNIGHCLQSLDYHMHFRINKCRAIEMDTDCFFGFSNFSDWRVLD